MGLTPDDSARRIAAQFAGVADVGEARRLTQGYINESFRITCRGSACGPVLLQRINAAVFPEPRLVMENIGRVLEHAARKAYQALPEPIKTRTGDALHQDESGACWRMYRWIEGAAPPALPPRRDDVYEVARAYGQFQVALSDYAGPALHETIPAFHDAPARLARLERVAQADPVGRTERAVAEIAEVRSHSSLAATLGSLLSDVRVPPRISHNDAKLGNVLLDTTTRRAVCVVDLDTVMYGAWLYDFGDMVRSMATSASEDEDDLTRVSVERPLFEALASGYLEATADLLTVPERDSLVRGGQVLALEQAVRFLTDFLEGDRYYTTTTPEHNLARCRNQLALLGSMLAKQSELEQVITSSR